MGSIFVVDTGNSRVLKFDEDWRWQATLGSYGTAEDEFRNPRGIAAVSCGEGIIRFGKTCQIGFTGS